MTVSSFGSISAFTTDSFQSSGAITSLEMVRASGGSPRPPETPR